MDKPVRGRAQHLTQKEIDFIRECYIAKLRIAYVANKINCSERNVSKYYGFFRAEGVEQTGAQIRLAGDFLDASTGSPSA